MPTTPTASPMLAQLSLRNSEASPFWHGEEKEGQQDNAEGDRVGHEEGDAEVDVRGRALGDEVIQRAGADGEGDGEVEEEHVSSFLPRRPCTRISRDCASDSTRKFPYRENPCQSVHSAVLVTGNYFSNTFKMNSAVRFPDVPSVKVTSSSMNFFRSAASSCGFFR